MEITDVRIQIVDEGKLKANVSITLDHCFVIRGIKIIQARQLFVAMPSRKMPDGSFMDLCHPLDTQARELIEEVILRAYYEKEGPNKAGVGAKIENGPVLDFRTARLPFPPRREQEAGDLLGLIPSRVPIPIVPLSG